LSPRSRSRAATSSASSSIITRTASRRNKDFALFEAKHQYVAQSGLIGDNLPNHKTVFSAVPGKRELASDAETLELRLEAPPTNGVKVAKVYTFTRGSYLIDVATRSTTAGREGGRGARLLSVAARREGA
jgi:YidC/Oxa1 family membrane protein insertase